MKHFFIISFLLFYVIKGFSQDSFVLNIEGAFQPYNHKSIFLGVSIKKTNSWKVLNTETNRKSVVYYERYINRPEIEKINLIGFSTLFGTKYFNIGINIRHFFQNKIHRLDLGPIFQLGYKYVWVSYSIDIIAFDNPYSSNEKHTISLNKYDNNIKIIFVIPIIKR